MSLATRIRSNVMMKTIIQSACEAFGHGFLAFSVVQLFKYAYACYIRMEASYDGFKHIAFTVGTLLLTQLVMYISQPPSNSSHVATTSTPISHPPSKPSHIATTSTPLSQRKPVPKVVADQGNSTSTNIQTPSPYQLAEQVLADKAKLKKLTNEIGLLRAQVSKSEKQVTELRKEATSLRGSLKKANSNNNNSIKAFQDSQKACKSHANEIVLAKKAASNSVLEVQRLLREKNDLQFEIEMLKCTPSTIKSAQDVEAFPQPFVLVLIDGDAYDFARIHFEQKTIPAGAHVANNIRREVQHHLLDHKDEIPMHAKIVTRLLLNENRYNGLVFDFARTFSETSTLFDIMNCGRGKERVDSKIHENFNLYIANPYCHRIFLAAAVDAGFARLLEPYMADKVARDKIVMIHPSFMIREIEELELNSQEWPSVFKKRSRPYRAVHNDVEVRKLRQAEKEAYQRAIDRQIIDGFTRAGVLKIPDWLARKTTSISRAKDELEQLVEKDVEVSIDDVD